MKGVYCALWTATDAEGNLSERSVRAQIEFVRARSVDGLLALGSTGEFLFLDPEARKALLELVSQVAGGLPVVANISDIRPAVVHQLALTARDLGLAAVSILPPFFYPVAQRDMVEFFVRAGEAAGIPLVLYNFPERTGNRIDIETIAAVTERIRVVAVKQSGGDFEYHRDLAALAREKRFEVVTGSDTRLAEAMALGVTGCVSGLSNAVPELVVDAYRGVNSGDKERTSVASERLRRIGVLMDRLEFPLNVAAAVEARGLDPGVPKSIRSAETVDRYSKLVADLRCLMAEWRLGL